MYKSFLFLAVLLIVITTPSCKNEKVDNNPSSSSITLNSYPLTIGYTWKYYTESHLIDSTGVNSQDQYYENSLTTISDTSINGVLSTKIQQVDSNYAGNVHIAYTYYANQPDGFYALAVEDIGGLFFFWLMPGIIEQPNALLGNIQNPSGLDTVFIPDTALKLLNFPSRLNDTWFSFEYNRPVPRIIKRKWLRDTTITTSAGVFNCLKLQMFWDRDDDLQPDSTSPVVYQYFSTKGLIKEDVFIALTSSSGPLRLYRTTKLVWINF